MNRLALGKSRLARVPAAQPGFSLVEVMVAVAVFTTVVIGTVLGLVQFQKYSRRVSEEAIAHSMAIEILEQIKNTTDFSNVAYGGQINSNLTLPANSTTDVNYIVHPILSLPDPSGNPIPVKFGVEIVQDGAYSTVRTVRVRIVWPSRTPNNAGQYVRAHQMQTSLCRGFTSF